jgi:hypothetical protein
MFVALGILHAMRMPHIVICGLSGSTIFFHIIKKRCDIWENLAESKMCVLIFSAIFV